MSIIENYNRIIEDVKTTAEACCRNPDEIQILTVSKTFPAETVQEAIDSGITLFGENRIQEAKQKIPQLKGNCSFHLIGKLQSNKCKDAVKLFSLIHSIEKLSTAEKLNIEASKINKIQDILLQVKTSHEESKSGASPDEIIDLVGEVIKLKNISLKGIMTVAPFTDDESLIRESFNKAQALLSDTNHKYGLKLKELSMGMSGDYKIAIECGATIIRIGSAIFGNR